MRGSLTSFARRRSVQPVPLSELSDRERRLLPAGFDAVGEALRCGTTPVAACAVVGRALARDGASLGEALSGLSATYAALGDAAPDFEATEALCVAWSEATLDFLHDVSCEDPLTGLASLPHVRTRLTELYREAELGGPAVDLSHALVVVEVPPARALRSVPLHPGREDPGSPFERALRLASVAEALRVVFAGEETLARVGTHRIVVLARRTPELGETLSVLRDMFADLDLPTECRLWIEGLPAQDDLGGRLLSELAR